MNQNEKSVITRVKILHDTTYKEIQKETNNYMEDISLLGGTIIGTPQLSIHKLPDKVINKIQKELSKKKEQQQKVLKKLPNEVYQRCLQMYSSRHPDLNLDIHTTLKALKFYGLKDLIKGIKDTQQKVISQYKQAHTLLNKNITVSHSQYYMKITYKMSYIIYKNSKAFL